MTFTQIFALISFVLVFAGVKSIVMAIPNSFFQRYMLKVLNFVLGVVVIAIFFNFMIV